MSDKVVCITGCGRGLGRALWGEFLRQGWRVAGCVRDPAVGRQLADEAAATTGPDAQGAGRALAVVADVTDEAAVARFAREVVAWGGAPDLLLNNAAVITANAPLWQVPADDFNRLTAVNINGVAAVLRHFLPPMIERGRGVVVNFSSGWGRSVSPEVAPYCASKWAIEGMTRALAEELPPGLAAVPLNPGVIDTDMLRSCFGDAAGGHPDAATWARRAVPQLAALGPADTGRPATIS